MSPAAKSKSKSKDKMTAKAAKEQQKTSSKTSVGTNTGNGSPASAYNPISGTFHTLDASSVASTPPFHDNGRFKNIDDNEEHASSPHGTVSEYDAVSNNGSCSGESEDPKEKIANSTPRQEPIPGSDIDRREKIRLNNEKKHQRQKERRAQELHERSCGYLMSRKLEALSQQLVAMGFSAEQATLALMLNEGRVEESVSWLFEGSEETQNKDLQLGTEGNLKIDIAQELARISAMEVTYKCSKQEIERAVVACEGDLEKAEETVKAQKQEPPATPSKLEETTDTKKQMTQLEKSIAAVTIQQRRSERDFNYIKPATTMPTMVSTNSDPGMRNPQSSMTSQMKSLAEKRWAATGSSPAVSLTMAPTMQVVPPVKVEAQLGSVNGGKINRQGGVREPVIMMQRPQSVNAKQIPVSSLSSSPSGTAGCFPNHVLAVESTRPNGKSLLNQYAGGFGPENQSSVQFYQYAPYKEVPYTYGPVDATSAGSGGSWSTVGASAPAHAISSEPRGSWSNVGASSPSLLVPPSLGLFNSWSPAGGLSSSAHVDWNTGGSMPEFDYNNIDWTLNSSQVSSKPSRLWMGLSNYLRNSSGMRMGGAHGVCLSGLQDGGLTKETSSGGLREWTSPFAGKDIFSVPRQFVTSPSP